MEIVFLGTGSAIPLPRPGHDCPQCRSRDVRDRREPSALLIDRRILIDAGPSIGALLASVGRSPDDIAAVVLTHRHRDAAGGLGILPARTRVVLPQHAGRIAIADRRLEAVRVPHAGATWGYLIDGVLAYFSDYSRITTALPALRRARGGPRRQRVGPNVSLASADGGRNPDRQTAAQSTAGGLHPRRSFAFHTRGS
ncbi:MAG TPA: MBL fold metallo-hydrolase [bacterium]|nr:MBL fold metallo-hydrolase [bacterium]